VEGIAAAAGAPHIMSTKTRLGDAQVIESTPELGDHRACTPVLVARYHLDWQDDDRRNSASSCAG
jgi:hypothetical protein